MPTYICELCNFSTIIKKHLKVLMMLFMIFNTSLITVLSAISRLAATAIVVTDATGGNAGHSFSAYCARAGIKFHGFADESTRGNRKLHAIGLHGTELHWVTGGKKGRSEGARKFANDNKILHMDYGKNIYSEFCKIHI